MEKSQQKKTDKQMAKNREKKANGVKLKNEQNTNSRRLILFPHLLMSFWKKVEIKPGRYLDTGKSLKK